MADYIAGACSVLAACAVHFVPRWEYSVTHSLWATPVIALTAVSLFRIGMSPYWVYKDAERSGRDKELVLRQKIDALGAEIAELTSLRDEYPHVVVKFMGERLKFDAKNGWPEERPVYVVNSGKQEALDVRIGVIRMKLGEVTFGEVSSLPPNATDIIPATVTMFRDDIPGVHAFEILLQMEWATGDRYLNGEEVVPLTITYRNHVGLEFATDLVVAYSLTVGTRVRNINYRALPRDRFASC